MTNPRPTSAEGTDQAAVVHAYFALEDYALYRSTVPPGGGAHDLSRWDEKTGAWVHDIDWWGEVLEGRLDQPSAAEAEFLFPGATRT